MREVGVRETSEDRSLCTKLNTNAMRKAPDGYTVNDVLGLCIAAAPDPSKD